MSKPGFRDASFPLSDRARVLKLVIASYVGFLLVYLFGFKATSSISVSALMTLPYGTGVRNTRTYVKKRFLAQIIGVAVAYPLYLFFLWAEFIPESQRLALPMTLSLVVTAWINRAFRLKIPDITMLIPGYLVILMTPSYALYPLMRPIYVLLGIFIGYFLNVRFLAPHYGKLLDQALADSHGCLSQVMDGYAVGPLAPESAALLDRADAAVRRAAGYLPLLQADLHACKKYRDYVPRMDHLERRLRTDQAAIAALRALSSAQQLSPPLRDYCMGTLQSLFGCHRGLFEEREPDRAAPAFSCPQTGSPCEIVALAQLMNYMDALLGTAQAPAAC